VASGALQSLAVNVVGTGVSFVVQILMARALGLEGYGVYVVALAAVNAFLVFAKFELDGATTRFLAGYVGAQAWSLARGFVRWTRRSILYSSLAVGSGGVVAILLFWDRLVLEHAAYPAALLTACALLVANAQLLVRGAQMQAFQRFAAAQFPGIVLRPSLLGLTIAIAYFVLHRRLSPSLAIAANLGATIVSVGVLVALVRWARPPEMATAGEEYDRIRWRRASYGLLAIGVAQIVLSQQSDLLIVGTMVSTQDSALYSAAAQFSLLVGFAQTSLSFVAAPMIAELFERKDLRGLQRLIRTVIKGNALVTVPIMLVLLLFGRSFLALYGDPFRAAYPVLVLLVIAASTVALVGSLAGFLLTMTEYQKEAAWIIGGSALLNLLLAVILTPMIGLVGTATATLIATVVRSAILVVFIRRRMGVAVLPFG